MWHYMENTEVFVEFFYKFARLEYALKRAGFLINHPDNTVEVNWNDFADKVKQQFEDDLTHNENLKTSVEFIENAPPRKLIRSPNSNNSPICWKVTPASQGGRLKNLLVYVRRIRNNLFHGEKSNTLLGGHTRDNRDGDLLRNSIVILDELVKLDSYIQQLAEEINTIPQC